MSSLPRTQNGPAPFKQDGARGQHRRECVAAGGPERGAAAPVEWVGVDQEPERAVMPCAQHERSRAQWDDPLAAPSRAP